MPRGPGAFKPCRLTSSPLEALEEHLEPGNLVFIQGVAATPDPLVAALVEVAKRKKLKGIRTIHIHLEGPGPCPDDEAAEHIRPISLFTGPNLREAVKKGQADYVPIFLSEIPLLFRRRVYELDIALVQVSPPDKHGYCSLGVSVDCTRAALDNAKRVVALVNKQMPRTLGDGVVHQNLFHTIVEVDQPIHVKPNIAPSPEEARIGEHIAGLIPDGATLQMGIGAIPNAVLKQLGNHQHLGVHSEMVCDGILPLVRSGALDNSRKLRHRGKTVTSFVMGSQEMYDFVDDNPAVRVLDCQYVNNPSVIAQCPLMHSINSSIEVDITGQAASDSIGERIYSGFGGQTDFLRGAALCPGGKPILALPSRSHRGDARIVPVLRPGAGVVTTRAHVHYVVTEHGIAYLHGKGLSERARALIAIAHPGDREALEKYAFNRFGPDVLAR